VSYTKGCYLGQEVVARIHYRGGVQRHMRHLTLDRPAETGSELLLDGKPVGRLTSLAHSLHGDKILGLAVVHQRAEVGAELEVRDGGTVVASARVEKL
jgi:folate-binding Fe-S cluster repair protein YgfZ